MKPRRKRKHEENATPDLMPMIDVTFQLLIFFIICTRFKIDERNHRADLPLAEGSNPDPAVPREQITVYCQWDETTKTGSYVVALGARGRVLVPDSTVPIQQLLSANDGERRASYERVFRSLIEGMKSVESRSGAKIEKVEISFAKDATVGASSGTAPWVYVSLALDAVAGWNQQRAEDLPVTFKFVDAQGRYSQGG